MGKHKLRTTNDKLINDILKKGAASADRELRMNCLAMALDTQTAVPVLETAQKYFDWVTAGKMPNVKRATGAVLSITPNTTQ